MKILTQVIIVTVISGAMLAMGAADMRSSEPAAKAMTTNVWQSATNATSTNTTSARAGSAWDRTTSEMKSAGDKAVDVTGEAIHKTESTTKEALKSAGSAIENTGERMETQP
jgi:hypothetical protein